MSYPRIRIGYILTKLELGGAQKHLLSLIERLDPSRFDPILITSSQEAPLVDSARRFLGERLVQIPSLRREVHPFWDLKAGGELVEVLKQYRVEIVHTHSSKAGILGRWAAHRAGIKNIVHTVHGFGFTPQQPLWEKRLYIGMEQKAAAITSRIIAVSRAAIEEGCRWNIGVRSQYECIPCGIDPEEFEMAPDGTVGASGRSPLQIRQELRIPSENPLVTMIACFKPQKAPLDFVRAAAKTTADFSKARFLMVGDGALRPQIEKERDQLRLRNKLTLAGWRWDIPAILAASDVVVLTSQWEGLPMTILEAMASRKPVVATAVGGTPEIVEQDKNGFLRAPGDVDGIAEAILRLLKNPGLGREMGACAKELWRRDYELSETVKRIENVYEELIPCPVSRS
ncbi:MAG: glycosyltransferase family 4 protein [Candidatus Omnitrophica bacterium]|nr:glycosyltransferase family 4 protein [Candidatus Omnitrophota bacterium]